MSKMLQWTATIVAILTSCAGQAAQYELGTPFPIACEGVLDEHDGIYGLSADDNHLKSDTDNDRICASATVAEERNRKYTLKYTLKDKEIIRILKTCSVGKLCRIVGYMNGLSHDVYFFVRIESIASR